MFRCGDCDNYGTEDCPRKNDGEDVDITDIPGDCEKFNTGMW